LDGQYFALLEKALDSEFVPLLPPLLDTTRPEEEQRRKNRSRAFSAFALHHICGATKADAAKSVVDDFDDYGIDAIFYDAPGETLYVIQGKLKESEQFSQDEALAFCQGVRKLLREDLTGFNKNVQSRATEIEDAVENCSHVQLVVAHTGSGISHHARTAIAELLTDEDLGDERLEGVILDYDSAKAVADLQAAKGFEKINLDLTVQKCSGVQEPRVTYFGLIKLEVLIALHNKYGKDLYERNIRTFLGHRTEVNASIQKTLADSPQDFLYLNNGVTMLCDSIEPKNDKKAGKRLRLRGLSVINGAQTIATSARYVETQKAADISGARVSLTIIKADSDGEFGKSVTRARNHQNAVQPANFAALDDGQERLRRELAYCGLHYAYKAGAADPSSDTSRIGLDEAAQALSMLLGDPRYIVWLKKEPAILLDTTSTQYKALFPPGLTGLKLANAVRVNRYIQKRMENESAQATKQDRLIYKHGNYAVAWILAKRVNSAIGSAALIDENKLATQLSSAFDKLRQVHLEMTKLVKRGPLALFRNQGDVIPLVQDVTIEHYDLKGDAVIDHKVKQQKPGQPYPEELFAYLMSKAPQIGSLA
jgi:AIPR protein